MVLLPCKLITPASGIFHLDLPKSTILVLETAISTKMKEDGVIDEYFHEAHDLLLTTNVGSEFLHQRLVFKHPNLSTTSLASMNIHRYPASKCLYKYTKGNMNYIYIQDINKQAYFLKEISLMYLSHLDDKTYVSICTSLRNTIKTTAANTLPIKYRVPEITTTITHHLPKPRATDSGFNTTYKFCQECSEDEDTEAVVYYSNIKNGGPPLNNIDNNINPLSTGNPKPSTTPSPAKIEMLTRAAATAAAVKGTTLRSATY